MRRSCACGSSTEGRGRERPHVLHRRAVVHVTAVCARVFPSRLRHNPDARWHTSCLFLCGMATPNLATRPRPSERHAAGLVMCRARNTPRTRALMISRASHANPPRSRWTALLLGLAVLLTTQRAAAATLTRGPFLQLLT